MLDGRQRPHLTLEKLHFQRKWIMCNVQILYSGGIHHEFMDKGHQDVLFSSFLSQDLSIVIGEDTSGLKQKSDLRAFLYLLSQIDKVITQFSFSCLSFLVHSTFTFSSILLLPRSYSTLSVVHFQLFSIKIWLSLLLLVRQGRD